MEVTIALSQRNTQQLESNFWAVSNPSNSNYGIRDKRRREEDRRDMELIFY